MEPQSYDWTKVKLPRRRWEARPNLTDTMEHKVTEDLNQHFMDKYGGENRPSTRNQKQMSEDQRQERIKNMLDSAGYRLGVAPLTEEHINRINKALSGKGVYAAGDNPSIRKQKTIKALIKSWALKNLQMTDEEWSKIQIEDITLTDNSDIVFIKFKTKEDVTMFTSKARNLPQEQGPNAPRLVMYVDRRGMKRHKALLNIAKSMREHSKTPIQTSVRTGK